MVTRLDRQKGVDLVIELATDLVELGVQLAILGNGDPALERRLTRADARHAGSVGVRIGFVDSLAHLIQGGSDILLMPSRWEPCRLTQMYAMRYGTVPVVSAVGGLDDTIEEGRTGFKFDPDDPGGLLAAIQRAVERYRGDAHGLEAHDASRDGNGLLMGSLGGGVPAAVRFAPSLGNRRTGWEIAARNRNRARHLPRRRGLPVVGILAAMTDHKLAAWGNWIPPQC